MEEIQQQAAQDVTQLLASIFAGARKSGGLDLEAVEMLVRNAVHGLGAHLLERLLHQHAAAATSPCSCGQPAHYYDRRERQLRTALGKVKFERAYYVCPHCGEGHSPRDRELNIEGQSCSPGVRRMLATVGSDASFEKGRDQMELLAGIEVTAKAVERHAEAVGAAIEARAQTEIKRAKQLDLPAVAAPAVPVLYIEMDGTAVPVVRAETAGRAGKNGEARTREVKLGCVFTQTTKDEEGRAVRDESSTTYVGAVEGAEPFGLRLYTEAWRRGWSRADKKVILADGAVWIWNLAQQHFPGAIEIVDLYHARQHLHELCAKLLPQEEKLRKRLLARCLDRLDKGKIEALVKLIRQLPTASEELRQLRATEAEYFTRNRERMRYPAFRAQGLFVGSGVIEAACHSVVAQRLKQSGMFWTTRGANSILALRCCRLNRRFEDYWADRAA
ncbi:MAG TPA: ISKra4 family transposase [Bryobacteraceae bacterium]